MPAASENRTPPHKAVVFWGMAQINGLQARQAGSCQLRHKASPARAYAVVVETQRVTAERVQALRIQAREIGLMRLLVVAAAGAEPRAAEGMKGAVGEHLRKALPWLPQAQRLLQRHLQQVLVMVEHTPFHWELQSVTP